MHGRAQMIDELLAAKKISPQEFKVFKLFTSDLGREVFAEMKEEIFWEEPHEEVMNATVLGLYEGRRSFLRSIKTRIDKVQAIINQQLTPEATA